MRVFVETSQAFDLAHQIPGGQSSYAALFGIDENALLEKLRRLGPSADLALRLAIAHTRQRAETNGAHDAAASDRYRTAGINIVDTNPEKS